MAARKGSIERLFATPLYRARLGLPAAFNRDLARTCRAIAADDKAGQSWCRENGYAGYTSYSSLNDLPWRASVFETLTERLKPHLAAFARAAAFDLGGRRLELDSLWINILDAGGAHSGHIHPGSVVSGTYYVDVPKGASAIRFEDPRLAMMMAAPKRRAKAPRDLQPFVYFAPAPGTVLLWESWLRHEVTPNAAKRPRISVSFNYRLG